MESAADDVGDVHWGEKGSGEYPWLSGRIRKMRGMQLVGQWVCLDVFDEKMMWYAYPKEIGRKCEYFAQFFTQSIVCYRFDNNMQ